MPTYSYQCPVCGAHFDRNLPFGSDLSKVKCPNGHTQVERIYTPPPVVFKGHGYYVTDHQNNRTGKNK